MAQDIKKLKSYYATGFAYSILLTLAAYFLTVSEMLKAWWLVFVIVALAVLQLMVQLIFFLHLNEEQKPRLKLQTFIYTAGVVLIVVFGSLWIMMNLSYHHGHKKSPEQVEQYIKEEELIHENHKH